MKLRIWQREKNCYTWNSKIKTAKIGNKKEKKSDKEELILYNIDKKSVVSGLRYNNVVSFEGITIKKE